MASKPRGKLAPAAKAKKPAKRTAPKKPIGSAADAAAARFVAEYLIDFNGTRAYMAAHPGVKATSAATEAHRMLRKPEIQAALAVGAKKVAEKVELTKERVYAETAKIAFFDPRKMFGPDGKPLQITELDDDTAGAIAGLEVLEEHEGHGEERRLVGHVKKYKIADKNVALERAAKLLALFKDDNAQRIDPLLAMFERMGRSSFPVVANPGNDDGR
jgi:phage terminase small subunit